MTYLYIDETDKTFTLRNQMFEYFSGTEFIRFEQSQTTAGFHKIHLSEYQCVTVPAGECVVNLKRKGSPDYAYRKSTKINWNI